MSWLAKHFETENLTFLFKIKEFLIFMFFGNTNADGFQYNKITASIFLSVKIFILLSDSQFLWLKWNSNRGSEILLLKCVTVQFELKFMEFGIPNNESENLLNWSLQFCSQDYDPTAHITLVVYANFLQELWYPYHL